jgi:hypothetical protein
MKVIVGAEISRYHRRIGALDNRMAYVLGLRKLGHEVYLIGDVRADECFDSDYRPVAFGDWEGRRHFEEAAKAYGVWPDCCMIYDGGRDTHGMSFDQAVRVAREADFLVNIYGKLKTPDVRDRVRCKIYIDLAPAQPQVYQADYGIDQAFDKHDVFFTVGLNIGTAACPIPTCGKRWHRLLHPIVMELWPPQINSSCRRFTTISRWSETGTFNFNGQYCGEKSDHWREFLSLPTRVDQEMDVALNIDPKCAADLALFKANRWHVSDPKQFCSLEDYRSYIGNSRGEFSIANPRYVRFNTGWTSDRTARYLASGKPCLVQSTGMEHHLPTGTGLITFRTLDEAVAGIQEINSDYPKHCRAARAIAEEYLDSDVVLKGMLREIGV